MQESIVPILDWNEVEQFFYRAMAEGWASGKKVSIGPDGCKHTSLCDSSLGFVLWDRWTHTPGSVYSAGTTLISYQGVGDNVFTPAVPIWIMQYGGFYTPNAGAFVRKVLLDAYQHPQGVFLGCRGPAIASNGALQYENSLNLRGSFLIFNGHETVRNLHQEEITGRHSYSGMALA